MHFVHAIQGGLKVYTCINKQCLIVLFTPTNPELECPECTAVGFLVKDVYYKLED
jgi:hypothetical protein